jgi:molybdate transport system substrate-binding protein
VHHRETPAKITEGTADAGPVWYTEVLSAKNEGLEVEAVEVGREFDQRDKVRYFCASMTDAPNPDNAKRFIDFLNSGSARDVFKKYGFLTD